ncbi:hypothetical protein SAMN05192533_12921 [Mesobacillus persicus]|uniref:Uncharacterized protein n=1 Tax=Mesobacillus persicus TaxID=930146 RepID=A0A1H8KNJ8_9BACI|nr:hypothetical protein [Mesobacillus persicus]SEN94512.1 hypothetical protein SAMN05192533_12921 [Mesobacillus persicus]
MFTDLNKELQEVKENLRKKKKYEDHMQRAEAFLNEEQKKQEDFKRQLLQEEEDVERLEGFTLTNIFYTITGRKLEKLDKEQQEVLAVKLKYKEALETIEDVEKEIQAYKEQLGHVADAEYKYKEILKTKEQLIHDTKSIWSEELYVLTELEAELSSNLKEYQEAIEAGEKSLVTLNDAIQSLDSAKGWSTFDMFGGGLISTAVKHSHMDEAKGHIHRVQKQLRYFQDELLDIENHYKTNLEVDGLLTFADYFFDGLIFDWFVHGQITDCYEQVMKTKNDVSEMVTKLKEQNEDLSKELLNIKEERKKLLESAN